VLVHLRLQAEIRLKGHYSGQPVVVLEQVLLVRVLERLLVRQQPQYQQCQQQRLDLVLA
jgi:hypothetical protein